MKLPNLPKPTRKPKTGTARAQLQVPRVVEDLYRDMRDRRLIVPAVALLVAIVAVPVALSADKEPAPAPLAYTPPEGAEAVSPAVLTEQPVGVRDYRERLKELKSKNPFASDFGGAGDGQGGEAATATDVTASSPTVDVPAPSGSTMSGPTTTNTDTIQPDNPTGDAATDQPGSGSQGSGGDGDGDEVLIVAPRIDVRGGLVGERKRVKDVESGDLLPSPRRAPIVMFLGASENLKYAHFAVSDGVTETEGDGICRPDRHDCEFLRLKEDDKQYFTYGPDGDRYSLKVTEIREEIVDRRKVADE